MEKLNPAYLAGVLDSDGSISFVKSNRATTKHGYHYRTVFQLTWKITPKAKYVMECLKNQFRGSFSKCRRIGYNSDQEYVYKYSCEGRSIQKLIEYIAPYVILKDEQVKLILEARKIRTKPGHTKTDEAWKREDKLYDRFKQINTKNSRKGGV